MHHIIMMTNVERQRTMFWSLVIIIKNWILSTAGGLGCPFWSHHFQPGFFSSRPLLFIPRVFLVGISLLFIKWIYQKLKFHQQQEALTTSLISHLFSLVFFSSWLLATFYTWGIFGWDYLTYHIHINSTDLSDPTFQDMYFLLLCGIHNW